MKGDLTFVCIMSAIIVLFAVLLTGKFFVIFVLARAFDIPKPAALRASLTLAPAGEFGFVLLALAQRTNSLAEPTAQVALAATLLSMLVAPLILARTERIVLYFVESEWTERAVALHQLAVKAMSTRGQVIVCGYGRSGQALQKGQVVPRQGEGAPVHGEGFGGHHCPPSNVA